MSTEWDSLILGGNELKTVGSATENARRPNSVQTRDTNSRGTPDQLTKTAASFNDEHFSVYCVYTRNFALTKLFLNFHMRL